MSSQPKERSKPESKTEKKTDATAILSPEELRAISGGAGVPVSGGTPGNPGGSTGPNIVIKKP
jgi:hypothetical protein